jgi:hypothetical protein
VKQNIGSTTFSFDISGSISNFVQDASNPRLFIAQISVLGVPVLSSIRYTEAVIGTNSIQVWDQTTPAGAPFYIGEVGIDSFATCLF